MLGNGQVRHPIGAKIFSVTVILLLLMAAVTYMSTVNLHKLNQQLTILSDYYIPLDQTVADIHANHRSEVLFFERLLVQRPERPFEQLQSEATELLGSLLPCTRESLRETNRLVREKYPSGPERTAVSYEIVRHCSNNETEAARALVTNALAVPEVSADADQVHKLTTLGIQLDYIARSREALHQAMMRFLAEGASVDGRAGEILLEQLNQSRITVAREAGALSRLLQGYTRDAAAKAGRLKEQAFAFNWSVTLAAVVLGLIFTALLTRNLVRPIRELLSGARAIEGGDLDVQVRIQSADEIAQLAQAFNFMVSGLKEKEQIKRTFGKYIDPRIVQGLLDDESVGQAGKKRVMSVYFSDIEGFTSICEELTPDAVVRLLNSYLTEMSQSISSNSGIIDKYIGDAIMAFWGPPFVGAEQHALLACQAALDQLNRIEGFRQRLPDIIGLRKGLPHFSMRVGIATGDVTVGSIGSESIRSYTVIGDTANLASRLESVNKQYGTQIMLSEATWSAVHPLMETREIDRIRVVGKAESVRIFELLGRQGEVEQGILALRDAFERGLHAYRAQQWDPASEAFSECLSLHPGDPASKLFLERVAHFRSQPAGPGWDGVWQFTQK
jgi:adenylate cyclase